MKTTDEIIATYTDPDTARIELQIVDKIIESAAAAGHTLKVEHAERDQMAEYDVRTEIFAVDYASLIVLDAAGGYVGMVWLVLGNGADLISNYTLSVEMLLAPAMELSEALS